ncbi:PTS sugar transporter subunit IIA [Anaerorhabdus sp.]|jgi:glucose-specific phosphotransferase system IIA component|uniref:PTS sugar transporter subunit IIA n=1 Tax=Anaerorhabdus sp. TaxID=1872524 RepID=UPI002FCB2044
MINIFNKKTELKAFASGKVVAIESINDEVFSNKMMGDGFAIISEKGEVYSPLDGEVTALFPTQHAIGITTKKGIEFIIHIGINTLEMDNVFCSLVKIGDTVTKDQILIKYDYDYFCEKNLDKVVVIVFTKPVEFSLSKEKVTKGDIVGLIKLV